MKPKFRRVATLLLALVVQFTYAQTKTVTGTISDSTGPLPGVGVVIKGTTTGTETDFDGNYTIEAEEGAVLQFTYVGMLNSEQTVGSASSINVTMTEDTEALEEVVVTALGISREKKAVGYAVTTVKGSEIAELEVVNPMAGLQGKVAGLDVTSAPTPGGTQNVMIRGASSFTSNQPLYIVDGVPLTNSQNRAGDSLNDQVDFGSGINSINPNDIENLTVLKGAAATALYGSRAANGVIMITTKNGKKGALQVDFNTSYSISRVGHLAEKQSDFGQGWSAHAALDENGNWGPKYDGIDRVWGNVVDNSQQIKPFSFLEDNIRDFYDYGENIKNAISFSGGNETTTYFLSLSQNSVDGVIPTDSDSYDRYTVATKGSYQGAKLKISSSLNFSNEKTKTVPTGQGNSVLRSLYEIPNDISIVDHKDYNNKFNNLDNYFTPYGVNPYYFLDKSGAEQNKYKFFGKFQFDYDILDNLKATYRFGGDFETSLEETYKAIVAFSEGAINDGSQAAAPGYYREQRRNRVQINHDLMLNYNKALSEDITLNAILGFNANERVYNRLYAEISSIDVPEFHNLNNSLTPATADQEREQRRLVGTYLSADISYKDYLFVNATARNDWSSTLPEGSNSFFYGGVTASFLITDFMRSNDNDTGIFDFGKIRVAYGSTGNDADPYSVYDRYVPAFSAHPGYPNFDDLTFPLNGTNSYMASNQLGNPNLEPEITKEFEVGFETRMLDNRIGVEFSYYNRLTEGLIEQLDLDPSSGYTYIIGNLGDVRNSGIELSMDFVPVRTDDFRWDINWNYAKNTNKVEKLDVSEIQISGFGGGMGIYAVEGMAMGQFKATIPETVLFNGVESVVVDGTGNPQASTDPELLGKDMNEKYRMGMTNTFTYKGFTLSGVLDYRHGGHIYSNTKDYMHWTGSAPESVLNDRNAFLVPNSVVSNGDGTYSENSTPVDPTALHTFYSDGGMAGEGFAIIDRSYLKLRNITLAYNVSSSFCEQLKLSAVRLSVSGSNFLLWTPAENPYIDPETTTFGNDISARFGEFGANPTQEVFTFGMNIKF